MSINHANYLKKYLWNRMAVIKKNHHSVNFSIRIEFKE